MTSGALFLGGLMAVVGAAGAANADVVISEAATANMSCSGGVCAPTSGDAVLNVADLENLLASGNVTVTTTGAGGVQAQDIRVDAALGWAGASTLGLDAYDSVAVNRSIAIAGVGGLALVTNDGGSGGTLSFGPKGNAAFANLSSTLSINGAAYTLEGSIATLASAISANPAGSYALAADYDASQDGTYSAPPIVTTFIGTMEGLGNTISKLSITDSKDVDLVGLFAHIGSGTVENLRLAGNIAGTARYNSVGGLAGKSDGTLFGDSVSGHVAAAKSALVGGLVGLTNSGAIVHSCSSAEVSGGTGSSTGGLVGELFSSARISNSCSNGRVKTGHGLRSRPDSFGGGIAGDAGGTIDTSFATGAITGGYFAIVGGLVGAGAGGKISNSFASGAVKAGNGSYVGGFIGDDSYGEGLGGPIKDSYSTGAVSGGSNSNVGGFAGNVVNGGAALDCYWDTTTSGTDQGAGAGSSMGMTGLTTQQLQSGLPTGFKPKVWHENANIDDGFPYLRANPPQHK